MFPFTSEYLVPGEMSLPEKALANTDKRISAGKPVIPAFLFTCLLWDTVREDAHLLLDQGNNASKAWRVAMLDALRDQSQYVSIPRRLADVVVEIWTLHFRLVGRKPKSIRQSMENRRFRAAYDFMLLRASMSEVDQDITDWWTKIQEVSEEEQDDMIDTLQAEYQADQEDDGEPNFNSVDYVEKQHSPKKSWNNKGRNGKPSGGRGKNNNRRRAKGDGQTSGNGQQRRLGQIQVILATVTRATEILAMAVQVTAKTEKNRHGLTLIEHAVAAQQRLKIFREREKFKIKSNR